MNRFLPWLIAVVAAAGLCWRFPLFHVVPLERAAQEKAAATFDPGRFTEGFWNGQLLKALDRAVKAEALLPAIQISAAEAKAKFSRSFGIGGSYTYFIAGNGRVVARSDDEISLAITPGAASAEVSLQTGLLFGNAVRDGTGLLKVSDYPNSQDFNGISEALNQLIEARVLPRLREQARVGAMIRFCGCAEVNDETTDLRPLKIIPISATVE